MGIQVPRVQQGTVTERGIPVVPTSGAAPIEAFGGGQAADQVTQEVRGIAKQTVSRADQELDRANKLWFLETESAIANKQLEIETNAKTRKGKDAFGLHDDTEKEFKDFVDGIQANNDTQRLGLQGISNSRGQSLNRTVTGHVSNEVERVENQESESYKFNLTNSAMAHYDDPIRSTGDKFLFDGQIDDDIDRLGLDKEAGKAFRLESQSKYHSSVINQILENGDDAFADAYVEEFSDELTEDAKNKIKPALEEANIRANAQSVTDDIIVSIPGDDGEDWKKRFDKAKKIDDPKLRDEVTRRLKDERNLQTSLEKEIRNDSYMSGLNQVEANPRQHPRDVVGAGRWSNYTKDQRNSLISMSGITEIKTDYNVLREFNALSVTEKAKLNESELNVKYLSNFDKAYRKEAVDSWLDSQKAVDTGSFIKSSVTPIEAADSFLRSDATDNFLPEAGKKLKGDEARKYRIFHEIFNRRAIEFQKKNGALPDEGESKEMASEIWLETLKIDRDVVKFGEVEGDDLSKRQIPFSRVGEKARKGLLATDVRFLQNQLVGFGVSRPENLDERAAERDSSEIDDLYSNLIQSYASAVKDGDTFRANQLVRQYKKDLKELAE